jgi:hypothetical protein
METKYYVGLLLTSIVQLEGSGWEYRVKYLVTGELNVQDLDDLDEVTYWLEAFKKHYNGIILLLSDEMLDVFLDLFKELREKQKKLKYLYFCCDNEIEPSHYSSLQKFKAYENS